MEESEGTNIVQQMQHRMQLLESSSFQLKGGGWYKDGYTKKPE